MTLGQTQVGKVITVLALYTDAQGTGESVVSSATARVANVNDLPTGSVSISGTRTQGKTLTASHSLVDLDGIPVSGVGSISYQWKAGGSNITGATGSTFILREAQVGKAITVTAKYTDGYSKAESKTSSATAAVANLNDVPTGIVTITGTATQGKTLTATNTLADADGMGTLAYQWKSAGSKITGATASTFVLTEAQVGKAITVTANYTDGHSKAESVSSLGTTTVVGYQGGTTGNDNLIGTSYADKLEGLAGNDTLDGGAGNDTMTGGNGSDIYYVRNAGDVVVETDTTASTGGSDHVNSYLTAYTLGDHVENGRIFATGVANLTGNNLNNVLYAGIGNNILEGGMGVDTVSYLYASAAVSVSLATGTAQVTGGSGTDTLLNIEKLIGSNHHDTLVGDNFANTLSGLDLNDYLSGGGGNDVLLGGKGSDLLIGGLGKDTLTGGAGGDTFLFAALNEMATKTTTCDTITDFSSLQFDKIDLSAIDANMLTGVDDRFAAPVVGGAFAGTFSGTFASPGTLYFDRVNHVLYGNTDGDAAVEFAIVLTGVVTLVAADFVL